MAVIYTRDELELDAIWLKQCADRGDFKEVVRVAKRISQQAKAMAPDYDHYCSPRDYDRIMNTLSRVDYGVGKSLPEVVW